MAQKKKSSSKNKQRRDSKAERMHRAEIKREVSLWVTIAISIFLFISNFGLGGTVGNFISGVLFGIFGLINYIFPVLLLVGTFFAVSNSGNTVAIVRIISVIVFVLFWCMLLSLIYYGSEYLTPISAFKRSMDEKTAGGILGGTLSYLCVPAFGIIGSYIIDVVVLIVSLVVFTGKSAMRGMKKGGEFVYERGRESRESSKEYREERAQRRAIEREEKKKRIDNKHNGVSLDTKIVDEKKQDKDPFSDEMGEVFSEQFPPVTEKVTARVSSDNSDDISELFPAPEPETETEPEYIPDAVLAFEQEEISEFDNIYETDSQEEFAEPEVVERKTKKAMPENELAQETNEVEQFVENSEDIENYKFPPVDLLSRPTGKQGGESKQTLEETKARLEKTLQMFGVGAKVANYSCGPAVTRFEIEPDMGVKVSKIVSLADDIKLNLAAEDIRIEAPIPGKPAVGIEVPNKENTVVNFRELIESPDFKSAKSNIAFALGKDIGGKIKIGDIAKMPHVLIAGATGSGKSVCINTIIMSILYKADPKDVKLIMIDPKVVELSVYNGIPHLLIPVVTDAKKAAGALNWAVAEMTSRYEKFAECGVRKIDEYNSKIDKLDIPEGQTRPEKMPLIVVVVDELADLMMVASKEVEESICRLAQLARAAGIHLIIATQRPSVNVITGLIKANMPSRIAFAVTSGIDSRTILDSTGAEKLLGKGDMLYDPQGSPKPQRVQGAFVTDEDVAKVVEYIKENNQSHNTRAAEIQQKIEAASASQNTTVAISDNDPADDGRDPLFWEAGKIIVDKDKASIGMLQRFLKVGFNRAARIMDQLEEAEVVGPEVGTKPRTVLMDVEQFEAFRNQE